MPHTLLPIPEGQHTPDRRIRMYSYIRVRVQRESASGSVRQNKDPAITTHAKLALVERGLGAKRAHAKSQSQYVDNGMCVVLIR